MYLSRGVGVKLRGAVNEAAVLGVRAIDVPMLRSSLFLLLFATTFALAQTPIFTEETVSSNVIHVYDGGWEFFVGGGVAAFDCDDNNLPDLFFAGGVNPAALYRNLSAPGGSLKFERVDGVEPLYVTGVYPLDIDSDGVLDLAVLRVGENVLYRGLGDCRFERANETWEFDGGRAWTTAFAATWEAGQAWPTLAFGNYVDRDDPAGPFGTCDRNLLYRPATGGYEVTVLEPSYCTLSMLFTDWNRSGTPALLVSNDRQYYLTNQDRSGSEQLWKMGDPPTLYTEAEGWAKLQIWGMGVAAADLTGDGLPDYYLTSMADQKLRTLAGDATQPSYKDMAFERGVTAHRPFYGDDLNPSTGWHAAFEDVDNDTFTDLFVVKGNVDSMPEFALADPNNLFVGAADGSFNEVAAAARVASPERGRGGAVVDLNHDGLLDIVVNNRRAPAQLWRNTSASAGHFVALRLFQPGPNPFAVGSQLEVKLGERTLYRELTVGGGHASGTLSFVHLGLGDALEAQVRVTWPGGEQSDWYSVEADSWNLLRRGAAETEVLP